jgi:hypothetical protein
MKPGCCVSDGLYRLPVGQGLAGMALGKESVVMSWMFQATTYSAYTEDEVQILGFADDAAQPEHYLLLQRAEDVDEQDVALGMDSYYVELGGQGLAGYGGIERALLAPGRLTLHFSPAVAWCQALPSLEVQWDVELAPVEAVQAALTQMFLDTTTLLQKQPE